MKVDRIIKISEKFTIHAPYFDEVYNKKILNKIIPTGISKDVRHPQYRFLNKSKSNRIDGYSHDHHHHQVPDLEQTLATMPLQTSLSSDNFKKFKPLLCPPVAELQRLSRNVIRCLPLSRLPSTLPVKDKNSKPLRLHTCPKNSICLLHPDFTTQRINAELRVRLPGAPQVSRTALSNILDGLS